MKSLVDNDVLLKGACYGLLPDLIASLPGDRRSGVLGVSQFVIPKLIQRKQLRNDAATVLTAFRRFVSANVIVEPTIEEQKFAAELESSAQALAVNLDTGESQLTAILVHRAVPYLLTGDKRAIAAIERLVDTDGRMEFLIGRIKCLEQLVRAILESKDAVELRSTICSEPNVDRALSICFSCASQEATRQSIREGLDSYTKAVRAEAPRVLAT